MKLISIAAAAMTVVFAGCAANAEKVSCLQPDRRVVVEMSGVKPKPKSKRGQSVVLKAIVQGDTAWDPGSAKLKAGGKKELDKLLKTVHKGTKRDKRPTKVNSVVIVGHTDRLEAADGLKNLDEERAKAVRDYLASKGVDSKLMFWEGKDAKEPMPVTKFCEM